MTASDLITWTALTIAVLCAIGCVYYAIQAARAMRRAQAAAAEARTNTQRLLALRRRPPTL